MVYLIAFLIAALSYLIGSISPAIIISKAFGKGDIRQSGSGNAGATNMLRTNGPLMGAATLILDILKGIIPVLIAWGAAAICRSSIGEASYQENMVISALGYIAGLFAVVGHDFPLYFGFRGGKGVATSLGVVMIWDWQMGLIVLVLALLIMLLTRYVSLGSISAAVIFVALELYRSFSEGFKLLPLLCSVLLAILLIARHHANIGRLLKGTENKLSFKKKEADAK